MGIKALNTFLKEHCSDAFGNLSIDILGGYRLAVDAFGWFYTRLKAAAKTVIFRMNDPTAPINRKEILDIVSKELVNFIIGWQNYRVTLVWCWDGQPVPEKIEFAKKKRNKDKEKAREELEELKRFFASINPLSRSVEQIKRYKDLLVRCYSFIDGEMPYFRNFIEDLGYPSLQAKNEGEKLASALAREGLCYGVWSDDTDNYPLGTPLTITGFAGMHEGKQMMSVVMLHKLIEGLSRTAEWNLTQFNLIDFCILCGTDFNDNMKGVAVGNAWKLIKKYGIIEYIAMYEPSKPIATLNHIRVREIFNYEPSGFVHESKELFHNKEWFNKNIMNMCMKYGLETLYQELIASTAMTTPPLKINMTPANSTNLIQPLENKVKLDPSIQMKQRITEAENTLLSTQYSSTNNLEFQGQKIIPVDLYTCIPSLD